jgi:hypothetical protein
MNQMVHCAQNRCSRKDGVVRSSIDETRQTEQAIHRSNHKAKGPTRRLGGHQAEIDRQDAGQQQQDVVSRTEVHTHEVGGEEAEQPDYHKDNASECCSFRNHDVSVHTV